MCDVKDSMFVVSNIIDEEGDNEVDLNLVDDEREWNSYKELHNDACIPGPKENNDYDREHGFLPNIVGSLRTILQCDSKQHACIRVSPRG